MKRNGLLVVVALFLAAQTAAAECELSIDRKPCPGRESEALKPYGGKNPTTETTKDTTADACLKGAEKASKIIRKKDLASKTVTAKFDGKVVGTPSDSSTCK